MAGVFLSILSCTKKHFQLFLLSLVIFFLLKNKGISFFLFFANMLLQSWGTGRYLLGTAVAECQVTADLRFLTVNLLECIILVCLKLLQIAKKRGHDGGGWE